MLEILHSLFPSLDFIIVAGLLLLASFFCYLATKNNCVKCISGSIFALTLLIASLVPLLGNASKDVAAKRDTVEFTMQVYPKLEGVCELVAPSPADMRQIIDTLHRCLKFDAINKVRITYKDDKIFIKIPQSHNKAAIDAQKIYELLDRLTKRAKLELLIVHSDSEDILSDSEVKASLADYEKRIKSYKVALDRLENSDFRTPSDTPLRPLPPALPSSMSLDDYMIAEKPFMDDTGAPVIDRSGEEVIYYLVLMTPDAAAQKDIYISAEDVEDARVNVMRKGHVSVVLSGEGAKKMKRATAPMTKGQDRLAVVLNNVVKCAPTVQQTLGKSFEISGLGAPGEVMDVERALINPISHRLKIEKKRY